MLEGVSPPTGTGPMSGGDKLPGNRAMFGFLISPFAKQICMNGAI